MSNTNWLVSPSWEKGEAGNQIENNYQFLLASIPTPKRVLIPLCGRSRSVIFFAQQGYHVVGCEFIDERIYDLLAKIKEALPHLSFKAEYTNCGGKIHRSHDNSIILVQADFFTHDIPFAGTFDLVYDRAALVALPPDKHQCYSEKIASLVSKKGALLFFDVVERGEGGPPFTVTKNDLVRLFPPEKFRIISWRCKGPRDFNGPYEKSWPPTGEIFNYVVLTLGKPSLLWPKL